MIDARMIESSDHYDRQAEWERQAAELQESAPAIAA